MVAGGNIDKKIFFKVSGKVGKIGIGGEPPQEPHLYIRHESTNNYAISLVAVSAGEATGMEFVTGTNRLRLTHSALATFVRTNNHWIWHYNPWYRTLGVGTTAVVGHDINVIDMDGSNKTSILLRDAGGQGNAAFVTYAGSKTVTISVTFRGEVLALSSIPFVPDTVFKIRPNATTTLRYPVSAGVNGQVLTTDGTGNLQWHHPGGAVAKIIDPLGIQLSAAADKIVNFAETEYIENSVFQVIASSEISVQKTGYYKAEFHGSMESPAGACSTRWYFEKVSGGGAVALPDRVTHYTPDVPFAATWTYYAKIVHMSAGESLRMWGRTIAGATQARQSYGTSFSLSFIGP